MEEYKRVLEVLSRLEETLRKLGVPEERIRSRTKELRKIREGLQSILQLTSRFNRLSEDQREELRSVAERLMRRHILLLEEGEIPLVSESYMEYLGSFHVRIAGGRILLRVGRDGREVELPTEGPLLIGRSGNDLLVKAEEREIRIPVGELDVARGPRGYSAIKFVSPEQALLIPGEKPLLVLLGKHKPEEV